MDEIDSSQSLKVRDTRVLLSRKIGILGMIISLVFSFLAIGSILAVDSQNSITSNSFNFEDSVEDFQSTNSDTSWIPNGYSIWENDSNVAWRYAANHKCDTYDCIQVELITQMGCPNSLYAALNWLDSTDNVISYDNASLPALRAMQVAKLRFDDIEGSASTGQLAEINCR